LREAKQDPQTIAAAHPTQIALQYAALLTAQPLRPGATDEILAIEPRFAELHLFRGLRAIGGGNPEGARRELIAARELLPASLAVLSALGAVEFVYARYATALSLFEEVLARGPDSQAQLGKAEALSYLKRHQQAITELDDLLSDPSRNPGDKYYWRAWNRLQLQDAQPAYDDATAALRFMNSADAYRLAGIATFNLQRLPEARGYFESALKVDSADCDSLQYLGQLDAAGRNWPAAAGRFNDAAVCFEMSIMRMAAELQKKEAQNTGGLLDEQIAAIRSDIEARRALYSQSVQNAAIVGKNAPASPTFAR
jgi:tetratricopeptide (TPR) repeat protein